MPALYTATARRNETQTRFDGLDFEAACQALTTPAADHWVLAGRPDELLDLGLHDLREEQAPVQIERLGPWGVVRYTIERAPQDTPRNGLPTLRPFDPERVDGEVRYTAPDGSMYLVCEDWGDSSGLYVLGADRRLLWAGGPVTVKFAVEQADTPAVAEQIVVIVEREIRDRLRRIGALAGTDSVDVDATVACAQIARDAKVAGALARQLAELRGLTDPEPDEAD